MVPALYGGAMTGDQIKEKNCYSQHKECMDKRPANMGNQADQPEKEKQRNECVNHDKLLEIPLHSPPNQCANSDFDWLLLTLSTRPVEILEVPPLYRERR
jgi:hypothetical protein